MKLTPNAKALAALIKKHGASHLARRVDCSESTLRDISTSRVGTSVKMRRRLHEVLGLPLSGWGAAKTPAKAAPKPAALKVPAPDAPIGERVDWLCSTMRARFEALRADPHANPKAVANLGRALQRALDVRALLRGEVAPSDAALLKSAGWTEMVRKVNEAMAPHALAMAAAASRLRERNPEWKRVAEDMRRS
jgi:hypothetical protein